MGSDVTPAGLKFQFSDKFKPVGKLQLKALECGLDPKGINVDVTSKTYGGALPLFYFSQHAFILSFSLSAHNLI